MMACDGCERVLGELRELEDQENGRHEEYLKKVGEYEADKREMLLKLGTIESTSKANGEKIAELSKALIDHMKDEMTVHERVFDFIAEARSDRHWIMAIGGGLILAFAWFYTAQYLPDQQHIHDTMLEIVKEK